MIDVKQQRRALCIIDSWLKSKNINCKPETEAKTADYLIKLTNETNKFEDNTFYINVNDILSRDNKVSQNAVNTIFKQLAGKEEVFVRVDKTPIAYYQDDYEGVYLRHTDLNRAPNISETEIKQYKDVVQFEARKALNKFYKMATQAGFEYDDLYSIGLVYLISFLHEHRRDNKVETRKILRVCLRQRYNHWAKTTMKKHKNAMSNGMFISETDYDRFRTEVKLQHSIQSEENVIKMAEYENKTFRVTWDDEPCTLEIRVERDVPTFILGGKEISRDKLIDLVQDQKLKSR